tara:strand:+ start:84 stop:1424 length:1341 start_codon:yes stop_codon:yes gene_type:complete
MKRSVITPLIFLFLLTSVAALEITTEKTSFKQGENFLATIQGNILSDIEESQIGFYQGHVEVPFDFGFEKIEKKYYIYATMPYVASDYSLKITDIYFKENNIVSTEDREIVFSVTEETADFHVTPGALIAIENFTLSFYNNLNEDITITYDLENTSLSTTLPLQDSKDIFITTENIEETKLTNLEITSNLDSSYSLPVYIIKQFNESDINQTDNNQTNNQTDVNITVADSDNLIFFPNETSINASPNTQITHLISLSNSGNKSAENIVLSVSDELKGNVLISEKEISILESGKSRDLNFTFEFPSEGFFNGTITVQSDNSSDTLYLDFQIEEGIPHTTTTPPRKTCAELNLKKCDVCHGATPISAADGLCCPGSCEPIKDDPPGRNYLAIGIVVALILAVGGLLFWKYKKSKPTAKDILNKRTKKFDNKIPPLNPNLETRGSLKRS